MKTFYLLVSKEGKRRMSWERRRTEEERVSLDLSLKGSAPGENTRGGSTHEKKN